MMCKFLLSALLAAGLLLTGCASYRELPAGTIKTISAADPVVAAEAVAIERPAAEAAPSPDYRIGPGDVLYINVQGRPELGSPVTTGSGSSRVAGSRVDGNGEIHLPMIGAVRVEGLSVAGVEQLVGERFRPFLNEPWVVVEIAEFRSQPLYLLGQFRAAGAYYMDRPYTLVQGISLGGGVSDAANLRRARLIRAGKTQPVDLYAVLQQGDAAQNVWLKAGDTIFIPDDKNQNVFVFGAVKKPGPVPMPNGQLNLSQALASADLNQTRGEERFVRIIRSTSATTGQLLVVDLERVLRGEALPFALSEGDIVFVPRSRIGSWNEALAEILPSLTTFSAILQPFVNIKYLSD